MTKAAERAVLAKIKNATSLSSLHGLVNDLADADDNAYQRLSSAMRDREAQLASFEAEPAPEPTPSLFAPGDAPGDPYQKGEIVAVRSVGGNFRAQVVRVGKGGADGLVLVKPTKPPAVKPWAVLGWVQATNCKRIDKSGGTPCQDESGTPRK